jgi:hypothetical protein
VQILEDLKISETVNADFKEYLAISDNHLNMNFAVTVRKTGSWPIKKSNSFTIPVELEHCVNQFTSYYAAKYQGRILKWNDQLSTNCFDTCYLYNDNGHTSAVQPWRHVYCAGTQREHADPLVVSAAAPDCPAQV